MAMLMLPPQPAIDHSRAGVLSISDEVIGHLLRFPKTLKVTGSRWSEDGRYLELVIEGYPLPERIGGEPVPVMLIMHQTVDDAEMLSIHVAWAHAPDDRWLLRGPEPIEKW
jgi:hypothetical protein